MQGATKCIILTLNRGKLDLFNVNISYKGSPIPPSNNLFPRRIRRYSVQFAQFFNRFYWDFEINVCKKRETFQHLTNAKLSCHIHAIKNNSSVFLPFLYLLSENIKFIEADSSRDAQINFDKCFVCCNQGSLGNYYH